MRTPKVSICIPAYKQVDYLRRTLESVQMQDFQDYEVIITDDSPDESVKSLIENIDFSGRLTYIRNVHRLGSPENWNEAIYKAQGEYIKMLHHDDWFSYKNSLSEFVKMLDENPEADFAFSAALVYSEKNKMTSVFIPQRNKIDELKKNINNLFFANLIGPPSSVIYRKSVNIIYDTNFKWVVDIDFYIRAMSVNRNFINSEKTLITSTTEARHQITNECLDNKCVEIFEYVYLYAKLGAIVSVDFFVFFKRLMKKYKVRKAIEISDCGYKKEIPLVVWLAIVFNRLGL